MATAIQKRATNHHLSIHSGSTVQEAIERMKSTGEEAIIVFEIGRVFGLLTEHDIFEKVFAKGLDPASTSIRSISTATPVIAPESIAVEEALYTLHEEKCNHLVLVDGEENVVGIVSLNDLLEVEVEKLNSDKKDLTMYIMADSLGG